MQVIDWIDNGGWTDHPECVHPVLRRLAISVNDTLDDRGRQRLLDLTPRLIGTASGDKTLAVRLAVFCARRVLHIFEKANPNDDRARRAIESAERWLSGETAVAAAAARAASWDAARAAAAAYAAAYAAAAFDHSSGAAYAAAAYDHSSGAAYAAAYAAAAAAYDHAYAASSGAASYAASAAAHAFHAAPDAAQLLLDVLDEYERITERVDVCPVDLQPVAEMMADLTRV
jgi:hypothetical protein